MAPTDKRVQVPPNCDLTLGMVCRDKSEPGRSVWEMVADERFANPVGIVQGGFVAAFADSAMGAASVTFAQGQNGPQSGEHRRKVFSANAEMKVSFLRPAKIGSTLTATAYVLSGGNRAAFVECDVTDDDGRLVAKASSTYMLSPRD
jgi:uncharacterized protein (TIGR00369 family)